MAMWQMTATQADKRVPGGFDGGYNVGASSLNIADNESQDEQGWDTDSLPAIHTRKGRTAYGATGSGQANLLTNFGTTHMVRAVGTALQYDNAGTWTAITGTFTDTDWAAANFNGKLILTNGTDNVKQWNGSALSDLNAATAPKGKYITSDNSRVWIAVNDVLNFCAFQAETDWSSANNAGSVQYYTARGGNITGLRSFYGDKYVWKQDSMAVIQGTNYYNFRLREISNLVGCVSNKTIQEVGDSLFWLGQKDVYAFKGGLPQPIGQKIRSILDSVNTAQWTRCFGATDGIRYFLGLVTGANTQPDTFLMYDPRYNQWRVRKTGDNLRYSVFFGNKIYAGDANGQTYQLDSGTTDNGAAISWSYTTKDFDEGAPELEKEYFELHLQIYVPTGSTLQLSVSTDQGATYTNIGDAITVQSAIQDVPVIIPLDTVPITHWARFKLSGTGEVKLFSMQRFFRLHPLQY